MMQHDTVKKQIIKALTALGYKAEGGNVHIIKIAYLRYNVYYDNRLIGVWDVQRNTFVD